MTNKKQKNIFHAMNIHSGICGSINLKRYFLKNIISTDEIVHTDELSSHRLQMKQIIFHAEEHGLFRTRINRIERIFHPDHISK